MKRCISCLLPETHETIQFDENSKCNVCIGQEYKKNKIDYKKKELELQELIKKYKGKYNYDCIVPFSGGKDSTWTVYYIINKLNLKPLVIRFDHGFLRPNLDENVKKCQRKLGFDMLTFTPNWKVVQKLMLRSFLDKGDFCWHCHTGIFSYPMWISIEKNIPLIFWGEKQSEYTAYYSFEDVEEVDEKRFNRFVNLGVNAEDMFLRLNGEIDKNELKPFMYPPYESLKKINSKSVCLGSYVSWNPKEQSKIIKKELGWKGDEVENVPPEYDYEKIECYMQGVRDYIKYLKRGYSRPSHLSAIDLRNKVISKEKALENIKLYEGKRPYSLDLFLKFIGLTEKEFIEVIKEHIVSPNKFHTKINQNAKKPHDSDKWSADGDAEREKSKNIFNDWKSNL
jgi:N-acetyl sugar amidotransferase|tara:strand:+ start:114 stop:1301 length:1188 start_codon:yes stop_codon:yes gene_type:complete